MNWKMHIGLSTFLLFAAHPVFSIAPVIMTGPVPAVAANYDPGSANIIVYTITNKVPGASFPITVSGLASPLTRTTVTNDCGQMLPRGPSSCNIGVNITPGAESAGQAINQTLSVNYQGRAPLLGKISFTVSGEAPPSALLISAGYDVMSNSSFLVVSADGGLTWSVTQPTFNPAGSYYSGASCSGQGSSAVCVAAGTPDGFLVNSIGGVAWTTYLGGGFPIGTFFNSTGCTGSGTTATCIAGGADGSSLPVLALSSDGGSNWTTPTIPGVSSNGEYFTTTCSGNGSSAVCVAGGREVGPLLVASTDGGGTWTRILSMLFPATGVFEGVSCSDSGSSGICVAAGTDTTVIPNDAMLFASRDGGVTWGQVSPVGGLTGKRFDSASCSGSGASGVCAAAGRDLNTSTPYLVISMDGAVTWTPVSPLPPGLPTPAIFEAVSCTGSGSTAICVAAGHNFTETIPALIVSTNGGASWSVPAGVPSAHAFYAASCTGEGANAICTASGIALGNAPLIFASTNGGVTWSEQTIIGAPTQADLYASAATGG